MSDNTSQSYERITGPPHDAWQGSGPTPDPALAAGGCVQESALHVRHGALNHRLVVLDGHRKRLVWVHLQQCTENAARLAARG